MKKSLKWVLISIILLVTALISNPTQADLDNKYSTEIRKEMNMSWSGFMPWGNRNLSSLELDMTTQRRDFRLFSLYNIDLPGEERDRIFLGVFGTFIPIK